MSNITVDKEQLRADIEALRNTKNKKEVDEILAKYSDALEQKDQEEKAAKAAKKKGPVKVDAPKKGEKKEPAKKETAKKEPAKKAAEKKETAKKETAKKEPAKKTAAKTAKMAYLCGLLKNQNCKICLMYYTFPIFKTFMIFTTGFCTFKIVMNFVMVARSVACLTYFIY